MVKRPMCLVCLLLMLVLCLLDGLGIPIIRGNPLPGSLQTWLEQHPEAVIFGEVQRCAETENSHSIYLKKVYLLYQEDSSAKDSSEKTSVQKISIENVRVFLKKEKEASVWELPAGTQVKVSGRLVRVPETRNPGEFDSQQYYACQHIYYFLKDGILLEQSRSYSKYLQGLLDIRECFAGIFEQSAEEAAPVFEAMILGEKEHLESETKMRYQMAGIIHILAISGMHISLLGAGLYRFLKKSGLGIFLSGMLSLAVMLQYGIMTGGSVAAMRAVCMFLLAVGAELLGRCYDGMTALAVSALLLVLSAPANLYNSGFLLSFGAAAGLWIAPVLNEIAGTRQKIVSSLLSSAAVQLMTLPILLYFYGEVSLAGIVLNLLVLPTAGVVLASGVCGGLLGLFSTKAAWIVLLPGRGLLFLYDHLCALAGKIPGCTWVGGQPKLLQAGIYYGLLFLGLFFGKWIRKRMQETEKNIPGIIASAGCFLPVFAGIIILGWHPWSGIRIVCLDVGQGDGSVIETSEGHAFLIDGGSTSKSGTGQYQVLPFLKSRGISRLDAILVSHTDEDHISGIRELLTFMGEGLISIRADCLVLPSWREKEKAYLELEELAEKAGVTVMQAKEGDVIRAGELILQILSPAEDARGTDTNEEGMVLEVKYGAFRGLFMGDIGQETEEKLLPLLEDVDFLKVGHHGSRYSTGTSFLEKIRPETAVISCSSTNTYGHPSPETIERLETAGCRVEYTMESGAVTCWSDGNRWSVTHWIS